MSQHARRRAVLVGVAAMLALAGYAVGHSGDASDAELARERAEAMRTAQRSAERRAYAAGRRRGIRDGVRRGRVTGARRGRREGKRRTQQSVAPGQTTTTTTPQTGEQPDYSSAPQNGTGTPSVDSPEGQRLLEESPDCQNLPPPPPNYDGPVQC